MKYLCQLTVMGASESVEAHSPEEAMRLANQCASNMIHEEFGGKGTASYKLYECEDDTVVIGAAIHKGFGTVSIVDSGTIKI